MKKLDHWQLQEAKSKFSKVVKSAKITGPQFITVHGYEEAVILSIEDYNNLLKVKGSLVEFFEDSPLKDADISFERPIGYARDINI